MNPAVVPREYKMPLTYLILGLVAGIFGTLILYSPKSSDVVVNVGKESSTSAKEAAKSVIAVDISGAVGGPGLYRFPKGIRVGEALQKAGGILQDKANSNYVSRTLNLAQVLTDGAKVYIPFKDEGGGCGQISGASTSVVNINTASASELDALPQIGTARAQKIIEGRPYSKIEELVEKKIISKSVFEKIKGRITTF